MSERQDLKILGRTIGTVDGWDGDEDCFVYYEFKPNDVLKNELPEGDLNFEMTNGYFSYYTYDENGQKLDKRFDVLTILTMVQRDRDPDGQTLQP